MKSFDPESSDTSQLIDAYNQLLIINNNLRRRLRALLALPNEEFHTPLGQPELNENCNEPQLPPFKKFVKTISDIQIISISVILIWIMVPLGSPSNLSWGFYIFTFGWACIISITQLTWIPHLLEVQRFQLKYLIPTLFMIFAIPSILFLINQFWLSPLIMPPIFIGIPVWTFTGCLWYLVFSKEEKQAIPDFNLKFVRTTLLLFIPPCLFLVASFLTILFQGSKTGTQSLIIFFYPFVIRSFEIIFEIIALPLNPDATGVFAFASLFVGDLFAIFLFPSISDPSTFIIYLFSEVMSLLLPYFFQVSDTWQLVREQNIVSKTATRIADNFKKSLLSRLSSSFDSTSNAFGATSLHSRASTSSEDLESSPQSLDFSETSRLQGNQPNQDTVSSMPKQIDLFEDLTLPAEISIDNVPPSKDTSIPTENSPESVFTKQPQNSANEPVQEPEGSADLFEDADNISMTSRPNRKSTSLGSSSFHKITHKDLTDVSNSPVSFRPLLKSLRAQDLVKESSNIQTVLHRINQRHINRTFLQQRFFFAVLAEWFASIDLVILWIFLKYGWNSEAYPVLSSITIDAFSIAILYSSITSIVIWVVCLTARTISIISWGLDPLVEGYNLASNPDHRGLIIVTAIFALMFPLLVFIDHHGIPKTI